MFVEEGMLCWISREQLMLSASVQYQILLSFNSRGSFCFALSTFSFQRLCSLLGSHASVMKFCFTLLFPFDAHIQFPGLVDIDLQDKMSQKERPSLQYQRFFKLLSRGAQVPYGMNTGVSMFEIICGIMTLLLMNNLPGKLEPKTLKDPIKISQYYFSKSS